MISKLRAFVFGVRFDVISKIWRVLMSSLEFSMLRIWLDRSIVEYVRKSVLVPHQDVLLVILLHRAVLKLPMSVLAAQHDDVCVLCL